MSMNQQIEKEQYKPGAEVTLRSSIVQMVGAIERLLEELNAQSYSGSYEQNLDLARRLFEALQILGFNIDTLSKFRVPVDLSGIDKHPSSGSAKKE